MAHLAGKYVLWRGIGCVQKEHVNALILQRRVTPHARVPTHIPSVKDHLNTE